MNDKIRDLPTNRAGLTPAAVQRCEEICLDRYPTTRFVGLDRKRYGDNEGMRPTHNEDEMRRYSLGFIRQELVLLMPKNDKTSFHRRGGI